MAAIKVPWWPRQEQGCKRQPRGLIPRGTLRGGPERPADDPQRNPQGSLCGGPARSAKEPQLPHKKFTKGKAKGGKKGKEETKKRPVIITVGKGGEERNWGPLSKTNAWRAGSFLEDMDGKALVYLQEDHARRAVQVEKWIDGDKEWFWFREKDQQLPREIGASDDHPIPEEVVRMQEDTPEERQSDQMEGLTEKVVSLEKENDELKKTLQELEAKTSLQAQAIMAIAERCSMIETAIMKIAQHTQQQEVFNGSVRASISGLENQVRTHQDNFQEVVRIFQNHEEHIATNGVVSERMAQYINVLIQESEKARLWIGSLTRESQAQEEVLRQHHVGQQVLAEVIKLIVAQQAQPQWQPPQDQAITGAGPTVTVVDDDEDPDRLDFLGGHDPHSGPPNSGSGQLTTKPPRAPKPKKTTKRK